LEGTKKEPHNFHQLGQNIKSSKNAILDLELKTTKRIQKALENKRFWFKLDLNDA
jgi:hypothetical protein